MQIDFFVPDRFPQSLDEHIVAPRTASIHPDADFVSLQHIDEGNCCIRGQKLRSQGVQAGGGDFEIHSLGSIRRVLVPRSALAIRSSDIDRARARIAFS